MVSKFGQYWDPVVTRFSQHWRPHHRLSRLMHALTRISFAPWKNGQINWFIRRYGVDMSIAPFRDAAGYKNFNDFFTRHLVPGSRPICTDRHAVISPVDGTVSQIGEIVDGTLFQAKGLVCDVETLLGGSASRAQTFSEGSYATLYLSPRDYHRVHMPLRGELQQMIYVPGKLFSVSPRTTRTISNLFAQNERVIALFKTEFGPMAVVLVGAIFVGSIECVWAGTVTPRATRVIETWDYSGLPENRVVLDKGAELGRFNMGSTVILLFGPKMVTWDLEIVPNTSLRMGQRLGQRRNAHRAAHLQIARAHPSG